MEILLLGLIIIFILEYNKKVNTSKFIKDNEHYFLILKEDNYDFLVKAKYGDKVDPNILFSQRIKNGFITIIAFIFMFLTQLTFINLILSVVLGFFVFKMQYSSLRSYYKKHLHQIDSMIPYFLKNMEILAQHYTIPVAIS